MLTLSFFLFCTLFVCALFGCSKIKSCNSSMWLLNADWLDQKEKFKLISRWGAHL